MYVFSASAPYFVGSAVRTVCGEDLGPQSSPYEGP